MALIRVAAVLVAVALVLAGCGDDAGSGGDRGSGAGASQETADPARTAAFCDEVRGLQDADEGLDISDPAGLVRFEQLIADAPAEVRSDLEYFVEQTKRFEDLDEEDPSSIGEAFGLFFDPEFIGAIRGFGTFLRDDCGIDVPGLDQLDDIDPDQLQEDLSDLDGQLDDLQEQLDGGLEELENRGDDGSTAPGG